MLDGKNGEGETSPQSYGEPSLSRLFAVTGPNGETARYIVIMDAWDKNTKRPVNVIQYFAEYPDEEGL